MRSARSLAILMMSGILAVACGAGTPTGGAPGTPTDAAAASPGSRPAEPAAPAHRLTIALPSVGIQTMALTTAAEGGFFEKHGLDVTLMQMADAQQVMMAMMQGRANLAVVPPVLAVQSQGSPRPLVAIGAVSGSTGLNVVIAGKIARERALTSDSSLPDRLSGLRGLRLGYPGNGLLGINTAKAVVEAARLDPARDVELIPITGADPGKAQVSALASGDIDGFLGHHPYLEQAIMDQGAVLLLHLTAGEVPSAGMFPTQLLAVPAGGGPGRDALTAVLAALAEAQAAIHDDPAVATDALRAAFPELSDALLEQGLRIYLASVPATPLITQEGYETALELFGLDAVPFEQVVDNSYLP